MTQSASLAELATALAKAQSKIKAAQKDSVNPHFKAAYADLASIWDACREALTSNGLSVVQIPFSNGNLVSVHTMLLHSSGEYIGGELAITATQNTPQAIGSAVTYARRYALAAMVGVAPVDDDGHTASVTNKTPNLAQTEAALAPRANTISDAQIKRLWGIAKSHNRSEAEVRGWLDNNGFSSTRDLTKAPYDAICSWLEAAREITR